MRVYPDTSFLVSLYLKDSNTPPAIKLSNRLQPVLTLTPFHELELSNAVELAVFRGEITPTQAAAARRDFEQDLLHWTVSPLPLDVFTRAVTLARRHTARYGTRSLDLLHVASAVALGAEAFITFDRRQLRLAKAAGPRVHSG